MVKETGLARIKKRAKAVFIPEDISLPKVSATLDAIDPASQNRLETPHLGGDPR
ncbi:MAG: hypothetical protein WC722_00715 [Rhodospirillales bacterium]